ncbi:hypothetical protein C8Q80DRAFT_268306 [Daedaleopsis nitida]|nr:hypothetical protein C8Q80DRAFT_268306 [Daedaleopsis nitida]
MDSSLIPSQPSRSPIEHLSDDILVEIFLYDKADPAWRGPPWFRVLWVCQHWSRVGRQSPVLWRKITMRPESKEGFLEASLQYSSSNPLYVSFCGLPKLVKSANLLAQHTSRIRHLTVVSPNPRDPGLSTLAHQEMPMLEWLQISLYPDRRRQRPLRGDDLMLWAPSANQLPSIRRLTLSGVSISEPLPVFPLLQYLHLQEDIENMLDIHTFVDYICRLPCLKELEMKTFRPGGDVDSILSFPKTLRRFSIEDNAVYVQPFLSAFVFSPTTQVRVFRALDYYSPIVMHQFDPSTHLTATRCLPDNFKAVFPILSQVTSVELRRREEMKFKFVGTTPDGNTIKIGGRVPEGAERELTDALCLLRDIKKIFGSSPLVELRINGTDSTLSEERDWVRLQRAFPRLERLTIEEPCANSPWDLRYPLLSALCTLRKPRGAQQADSAHSVLPWPRLRTLALATDLLDGDDERLIQTVAETLEFRASRGCRLGELRIILRYIADHLQDKNEERKEPYRDALSHLVDCLELDVVRRF